MWCGEVFQKYDAMRRSVSEICCGAAKCLRNMMWCGQMAQEFDVVRRSVAEI
jgi:hypothetical protein